MTDLPQWAMEKAFHAMDSFAVEHLLVLDEHEAIIQECIARALVEQDRIAEARGIERAAKVCDAAKRAARKNVKQDIASGNSIRAEFNRSYATASGLCAAAIRKLMEQDNEQ